MKISESVKGLLAMTSKRQIDLAEFFGTSKQYMANKMSRNSWFASDLVKVAAFCGCEVAFIMPDGQKIVLTDSGEEKGKAPDA